MQERKDCQQFEIQETDPLLLVEVAFQAPTLDTTSHYSYSSIPKAPTQIPIAMVDEESGVPDDENVGLVDRGSDDENGDNGSPLTKSEVNGLRRKKPRRPMRRIQVYQPLNNPAYNPQQQPRNSLMLRLTCLSVVTLVVLGSVGLLTYLEDKSAPTYQYVGGASGDDILMTENDEAFIMGNIHSSSTGSLSGRAGPSFDQQALKQLMADAGVVKPSHPPQKVQYSANPAQSSPFDFSANPSAQPLAPLLSTSGPSADSLGYIKMPHLVNNQLVFCSQGDVFVTTLNDAATSLPATKLTTTVGNVLDPRLHPNLRYLAYTATYSGRRDIYLMDLQRGGSPAVRLTFWDLGSGVSGLVGWLGESALVFRAYSNEVSLPDLRLYVLHLDNLSVEENGKGVSVLEIEPIPLSQAREAARFGDCWHFVRVAQSSNTIRYVGGTAEQLYRYCDGAAKTDHLFVGDTYKGTSKSPQMYKKTKFLFFLSDRARSANGEWQPDRMNVWAAALDKSGETLPSQDNLIQITDTTCDFEGRVIQEFTIDSVTGNMLVRIGADLYTMSATSIQAKLKAGSNRLRSRFLNSDPASLRTLEDSKQIVSELPEQLDDNSTNLVDDISMDNEAAPTADALKLDGLADLPLEEEANTTTLEKEVPKVYYQYSAPELESRQVADSTDHVSGSSADLTHLPISIHSDFHEQHERLIPVDMLNHLTSADIFETAVGTMSCVMTLRGQLWVAPVIEDGIPSYMESGRNLPARRYRVAPGSKMGGVVRILSVRHVPNPVEDETSERRLAVILATDPLTETAEQAFYLVETHASATPLFLDMDQLPKPFLGGHVSGGSTKTGGLGSVEPDSWVLSPCGRRMAWTDRDGRIMVMNLPQYQRLLDGEVAKSVQLPQENESGEPMIGEEVDLLFSPGGRYLAVTHNARNQFSIISLVDLGDPKGEEKVADIQIDRIVQATPSRFNSVSPCWGKMVSDMHLFARETAMATLLGEEPPADVATTLFFLSDRDIKSDVSSPWGTRQPMPHFKKLKALFALPLRSTNATGPAGGAFVGGGATEVRVDEVLARKKAISAALDVADPGSRRRLSQALQPLAGAFGLAGDSFGVMGQVGSRRRRAEDETAEQLDTATAEAGNDDSDVLREAIFPEDMDIDLGADKDKTLAFARQAYRVSNIPESKYTSLLSQTPDDGSFVLIELTESGKQASVVFFEADSFPSDTFSDSTFSPTSRDLSTYGISTSREFLYFGFGPDGQFTVVPNTATGVAKLMNDEVLDHNIVSSSGLHLSVWPSLEYRQLYDDAWRMLRDYFYDPELTGIDWESIHDRFLPLVNRCAKREELDDVLIQMASELSALHVFVYGGEYNSPMHGDRDLSKANEVASLGASLRRNADWNGYEVVSIPESDPDFSVIDQGSQTYSPLSDRALRLSGQQGLDVGDVIVGVNGESVMTVPDIHMLLRGTAGTSVRLDVLRLSAGEPSEEATVEPIIAVPISPSKAGDLLYYSWEWKTRQLAENLAAQSGFSVGYVHLQDMSGPEAEDAFARGFFPNYDKEAFILDVRHNRGGNIDSWVLDVLQRKAWMYWQSRDFDVNNGGLGWDEQFAFRGHIIVLIDEKTSSDGEGVSRGISELGIGRLVGTRTWGGGIWLASDNRLVDGGIASAPEIGTYNENFGWGLGIEQMGVDPDIVVDNDPHQSYEGTDTQLERAIQELKKWLDEEPIVMPKPPIKKKDMTMGSRECPAI